MLATIASQVSLLRADQSFWAYFPAPPIFHPVSWGENDNLKIFTNDTDLIGGISDSLAPHKTSESINFIGYTNETPLCFTSPGRPPIAVSLLIIEPFLLTRLVIPLKKIKVKEVCGNL